MKLVGQKVRIVRGLNEGVEGYVKYADHHSVAIKALGMFGQYGYYGMYYARRDDIERLGDN